jgi:hypothetical protein
MSLGDGGLERQQFQARLDHLAAQAEADRAARMAGYKSPFRRLLDRLRRHRYQPGAESDSFYGDSGDTGQKLWPRR